jgi:hypothetical protein
MVPLAKVAFSKYPSVNSPTPNLVLYHYFNHFYLLPSDKLFLYGTLSRNMGVEEMKHMFFKRKWIWAKKGRVYI